MMTTTTTKTSVKGDLIDSLRRASRAAAFAGQMNLAKSLAQEADGICVMREIEGLADGEKCPVCGKVDC